MGNEESLDKDRSYDNSVANRYVGNQGRLDKDRSYVGNQERLDKDRNYVVN